jgi:hypothetical protein
MAVDIRGVDWFVTKDFESGVKRSALLRRNIFNAIEDFAHAKGLQ